MRKRIVPAVSVRSALHEEWLDLEGLAEIRVTSEDPAHPIEAALLPGGGAGWRASEPGPQTIQIVFDNGQNLSLIHLVFVEEKRTRSHEFVLRWAARAGEKSREIVRQQYNFSPVSSEVENYEVNLQGVKILEFEIVPSGGSDDYASLTELRLR